MNVSDYDASSLGSIDPEWQAEMDEEQYVRKHFFDRFCQHRDMNEIYHGTYHYYLGRRPDLLMNNSGCNRYSPKNRTNLQEKDFIDKDKAIKCMHIRKYAPFTPLYLSDFEDIAWWLWKDE